MTGYPGERRNRAVALVTDDFRLYHELAPYLESQGVRVLGLKPGEPAPPAVKVLVGGPPSDPRSIALRADREATLLAIYAATDARPTARAGYHRIVFGVDPGEVIGLAVLADGETLLVGESRSAEAAADRLAVWSQGLSAQQWEVHVGDGHPRTGLQLRKSVAQRLPTARVAMVPEERTTPFRPVTHSRHTDAAILIALREPHPER